MSSYRRANKFTGKIANVDKRTAYKKCVFRGCTVTSRNRKTVSLHCFPVHDSERLIEWMVNSGNDNFADLSNEALRKRYICTNHFAEKDKVIQIKLRKDAVPVLYQSSLDKQESMQNNNRKPPRKCTLIIKEKMKEIEQLKIEAHRLRRLLVMKNKRIASLERELKSYRIIRIIKADDLNIKQEATSDVITYS